MDQPNPNPYPSPNPTDDAPSPPAESAARLAALSLRGTRDLPPDFHTAEIHDLDDDDDEGYLTAASRGGGSTSAWKEAPEGLHDDDKDGDDVSQPSPSSSGYAGERGSSLDDDPDPDADPDPDPEPAQDWPRDKKHLHEVSSLHYITHLRQPPSLGLCPKWQWVTKPAALMFQDDASSSWRKRKKHFFILSNSGKPIYSRYGGTGIKSLHTVTLHLLCTFPQPTETMTTHCCNFQVW